MPTVPRSGLGLLLLSLTLTPASAQRVVPMLGAGVTFSGADVSATDMHFVAGAEVRFPAVIGVRLDGMTTDVPQSHLKALSGDLTLHSSPNPDAPVQPYLVGGGTVYFPKDLDTQWGMNVGLGVGVQFGSQSPPRAGVFVEGRYFRIFNYNTQRDDLLLASGGMRIAL